MTQSTKQELEEVKELSDTICSNLKYIEESGYSDSDLEEMTDKTSIIYSRAQ
jgi:hypothetical protein